MSVIRSIATALPPVGIEQTEAGAAAARLMGLTERRARALGVMYAASGVGYRYLCALDDDRSMPMYERAESAAPPMTSARLDVYAGRAPELAHEACERALTSAGCSAGDVDHLVVASCTGAGSPGVDHALIESLGLRRDVQRTLIGFMGCHAAVNALSTGGAIAEARGARVLVVCVELCSLHFQHEPGPGGATANALFGDGAGACVVEPDGEGLRLRSFTSRHFPGTADLMTWRIGDYGFEMTLSARVPQVLESEMRSWADDWLERSGCTRADIDAWVIHPGGPRIVESALKGLELSPNVEARGRDLALRTLHQFGNMSSPTLLFMLDEVLRTGEDSLIACAAFGPGLSAEGVLLERS